VKSTCLFITRMFNENTVLLYSQQVGQSIKTSWS
jgi:hypothetical protein